MNEDWNPAPEPGSTLETPAVSKAADKSLEKQDTLNSSGAFSAQSLSQLANQLHEHAHQTRAYRERLQSLRNSPGFKLIAHSTLQLKASQMDMDYPPRLRDYIRQQLKQQLKRVTGKALSPDKLSIRFSSELNPAVDDQGNERYTQRMTLTDIGILSFNGPMMHGLMQLSFTDKPLDESTPGLTARSALELIINARWPFDYPAMMEYFWDKHRDTYRALAKLSFLDELARQYERKDISRDGYQLALEALGLEAFPQSGLCLHLAVRGTWSTASMLSIDDQLIPEAFHLQSKHTSHCFIHTPGGRTTPVDYISNEPRHMTRTLVAALDAARGRQQVSGRASLSEIEGDVFTAITAAQEKRSLLYLESQVGDGPQPNPFNIIERSLSLLSALDIWQSEPGILQKIPTPLTTAAEVMTKALQDKHGWQLNPDRVFIRYLRGTSITPLGDVRHPTVDFQVPDEKPVSLSEALVSNYRVAAPVGYIDHGGRSAVYHDSTGQGVWEKNQELPIDPQAIENLVRDINFLDLMHRRIDEFWGQHEAVIDEALQAHFMSQALLCFKQGILQRSGFDLVVRALDQLSNVPEGKRIEWSIPGFFLQHSIFEGPTAQYCPSLLVLTHPGRPQRVLYQAGALKAFIQFASEDELNRYLRQAARSRTWREAVLTYVPVRHQQRLTYILKLWAGEQTPSQPVYMLRPWTDVLLNQDARKALAHERSDQRFAGPPFVHIRRMLRQNGRWDADDIIVTSQDVSLRYWTRQLSHLQFLLAPMSVLLTPALIASLATELGITTLNIASANLPGARYEEKRQALLSLLSLALLQRPHAMPRLTNALRKLAIPVKPAIRPILAAATNTKSFGTWLGRSMRNRETRFEQFFHTDTVLKSWNIPGHPTFTTQAVKAWKLHRQFLLWTAEGGQARTLVVSSHGYFLPWSKKTVIPNGTELGVYAPHGFELVDPRLHRVVSKQAVPFARLNTRYNSLVSPLNPPYELTERLLAGTARPGMIKNYRLAKFQTPYGESYRDISHIVRNSNQSPFTSTLPSSPMDVLTVRNRFGMPPPTLERLFNTLSETGIHYDRILLVHCRCSAFKSLLGMVPVHTVP